MSANAGTTVDGRLPRAPRAKRRPTLCGGLVTHHAGTPAADCISARIGELKAAQAAEERAKADAVAKRRAEDEARAKAEAERQRLAMLEQQRHDEARKVAEAEAARKRSEAANSESGATDVLVRALQTELRRVGCDPGGDEWGSKAKGALR
jgi:hypothetical protein